MTQQTLTGRIALLTGGSRGLGKDTAMNLASRGCDVILTYRKEKEAADAVVANIQDLGQKAVALQLDVAQALSFEDFASQVKHTLQETWQRTHLDFLVNNAGAGAHAMIAETSDGVLDQMYNIHFKGPFLLTQKLLPLIAEEGRIVNISTGLARFTFPGYAAYASMKGAVEVFTRYLAKELGGRKITANCIAPGAIDNDFNKHAFDANPQVKQVIAGNTALGRVGVSEDIGSIVAFLCSPDAGWITGQRLEASGGMFL